jgi:hypothetical protein
VVKFAVEVDDNAAVSETSKKFGNAKMQEEIQAKGYQGSRFWENQ